jgi:hypothetical protein
LLRRPVCRPTSLSAKKKTPIRCSDDQVSQVQQFFPCQLTNFPCKWYLGVPLSVHALKKAYTSSRWLTAAGRLPSWKAGLVSRAGRTSLVKVTLSLGHTNPYLHRGEGRALYLPCYPRSAPCLHLDRHGQGDQRSLSCRVVSHRQACGVWWSWGFRPHHQGYALSLRCAWLARTDPSRAWSALPYARVKRWFRQCSMLVSVQVGNGVRALFWSDKWLDGASVASFAPDLVMVVSRRARDNRTVAEALLNAAWVWDILGSLPASAISQYLLLWNCPDSMQLDTATPDKFIYMEMDPRPAVLCVVGLQDLLHRQSLQEK